MNPLEQGLWFFSWYQLLFMAVCKIMFLLVPPMLHKHISLMHVKPHTFQGDRKCTLMMDWYLYGDLSCPPQSEPILQVPSPLVYSHNFHGKVDLVG